MRPLNFGRSATKTFARNVRIVDTANRCVRSLNCLSSNNSNSLLQPIEGAPVSSVLPKAVGERCATHIFNLSKTFISHLSKDVTCEDVFVPLASGSAVGPPVVC